MNRRIGKEVYMRIPDFIKDFNKKTKVLNSIKDDRIYNYMSFEDMIKSLQNKARKAV